MPEYSDQDIQEIKDKARDEGFDKGYEKGRTPILIGKLVIALVLLILGFATMAQPTWFSFTADEEERSTAISLQNAATGGQDSDDPPKVRPDAQVASLSQQLMNELALDAFDERFSLLFFRFLLITASIALFLTWALELNNKQRVQASLKDRASFVLTEGMLVFLVAFLAPAALFAYSYFGGTSSSRAEAARELVRLADAQSVRASTAELALRQTRTEMGEAVGKSEQMFEDIRSTVAHTINGYMELGAVLTPMALRLDCSTGPAAQDGSNLAFRLYFGDDIKIELATSNLLDSTDFEAEQLRIDPQEAPFLVNEVRNNIDVFVIQGRRQSQIEVFSMDENSTSAGLLKPARSDFRWANKDVDTLVKARTRVATRDSRYDDFADGGEKTEPVQVSASVFEFKELFGVALTPRETDEIGPLQREIVAPRFQKVVAISVPTAQALCGQVAEQLLRARRPSDFARN